MAGQEKLRCHTRDGGCHPPEFLFPGLIPLLCFAIALWFYFTTEDTATRSSLRFGLLLTATGFMLSLGPWLHWGTEATGIPLPAYLLYEFVPGFSVIRAPARFSLLTNAGLALLTAVIVPAVIQSIRNRSTIIPHRMLQGVFFLLIFTETINTPLPLTFIPRHGGLPAVESWLARQPEQVVIYYPLRYHLTYMYFSLWHWKKLINGWTGYMPPVFLEDMQRLNDLSKPESFVTMSAGAYSDCGLHTL